jgi:N-acylglucosamine 2-epimerase
MYHEEYSITEMLMFYEKHLKDVILPFWLNRSIDMKHGGYFTCFNNNGTKLLSTDKYTWSQGRMVWILSKLSEMDCFTEIERNYFFDLAKMGAEFLVKNCLLDNGNCTFLMDREGRPKYQDGEKEYDTSIYADCFVILGLSRYAMISGDVDILKFSKSLYGSVVSRINDGIYKTEPYPIPPGYKAHGIPMIMLNISSEFAYCTKILNDPLCEKLTIKADKYLREIMEDFIDNNYVLNEFIHIDNKKRSEKLIERYVNPGHIIEDMWFIMHHTELKDDNKLIMDKVTQVVKKTFEIGWDNKHGGLFLYADKNGGRPRGSILVHENDKMIRKVTNDWSNKLWWVHSESLYTLLLLFFKTGDRDFLKLYKKVFDYAFRTFPNPDITIGEWIQIRNREGIPVQKTVALPVKDPFHIIRNIILIYELLKSHNES